MDKKPKVVNTNEQELHEEIAMLSSIIRDQEEELFELRQLVAGLDGGLYDGEDVIQ